MARGATQHQRPVTTEATALGSLARIYWMLFGYMILGLSAGLVVRYGPSLSKWDLAFWAVAASIVAVRYVDVTRLHGETADGDPATMSHWRRYALTVTTVAAATWLAAHGVALVPWR